jgi:aminoglycoside phosphotransferase (APT) family kinase protein
MGTNGAALADEVELIRDLLDCDAEDIVYDDQGWDSRVYLVDEGNAVFKFPRSPTAKDQYRHEIDTLELLDGGLSGVRVPVVKWKGPDLSWFGYEGFVGQQLSDVLATLPAQMRELLGSSLGGFLAELHRLNLPGAPEMHLEQEVSEYSEKFQLAKSILRHALNSNEYGAVEKFMNETLPTELERLGVEPLLGHGDLGPWNIIVTDNDQLAVIDFGDVGYYDPSKDFSGFGDERIFESALASYGDDALLREKATLRINAFPILDIPFYIGKQDESGIAACIELARRSIIEGDMNDSRYTRDS